MKAKKKRGIDVPPKVQAFINSVTSLPFESIEASLDKFNWEYEKGDFYHWVELVNHFDSYFDQHIRPRQDLRLEGEFTQAPSFPKEAVLQVLRVTRVILENCINKHCYSSYEHLSSLLASTDTEVVIASLQVLAAFVKKPVQSNRAVRWHGDHALNARLFSLSQGWGGKEEGLGLVACAVVDGCDSNAVRLASKLHFEFYSDGSPRLDGEMGLKTIHKENLQDEVRSELDLLQEMVHEYKVPVSLRFSLLTRLRFAKSFANLYTRRRYLCIRLLAFTILVQSNPDPEDLTAFFSNEPEFVHELVTFLHCEDSIPEDIRILAIRALAAQAQDRPRQSSVLSAISAGGNRGILPTLVQNAVGCLRGFNSNCSLPFVESLLYLVTVLVSTSAGCSSLRECGLIPTLLPLLKDTNPLHTHLVTAGIHILEASMDYSNQAATLFRDLEGLDDAIARLKFEIDRVEEDAKRHQDKGNGQVLPGETVVSSQSRLLLKVLLRAISLGTYAPGNAARLHGSEESALASCLCTIFRHAKEFGGGVFALAASLMSDLIHKDPTSFPALDSAGLPGAFLDAIYHGVLPSSEAVSCIPHSLDALCLNASGLAAVQERNTLGCLVKIFTSKSYLRALSNETPSLLASGLDELMRHAPTLRGDGVSACIGILKAIAAIGGIHDAATDATAAPSDVRADGHDPVPMESADSDANTLQQVEASTSDTANAEIYVLEYIQNAARLLEALLQNAETSRIFVEKNGVEAFLRLYALPNIPVSFGGSSVAHSMSSAFRAFSPTHAGSLSRAVCGALKESLGSTLEAFNLLSSAKLSDLDTIQNATLMRCLSATEMYLSLASVLVRSTNTMMTELSGGGGKVLSDVGKVYQEVLWQLSVLDDAKAEPKSEELGHAPAGNTSGSREGEEDLGAFPAVQYVDPVSIRVVSTSHWEMEPDFLISGGDGFHRRSRREHGSVSDLFSQRFRRLSRHVPAPTPQVELETSSNAGEGSQSLEAFKLKSSESVNYEVMTRLVSGARGLFVALGKSMTAPSRRRDDIVTPGSAAKAVSAAIAKLLHLSLAFFQRQNSSPWGVPKCRYLQKLAEDILLILFDSRRHLCNMLLLNYFYAHDVLGCLLGSFQCLSEILWAVMQEPDVPMEAVVCKTNECGKKACVLEALQSCAKLMEHLVTPSWLLPPQPMAHMLVQQVADSTVSLPRNREALVERLQSRVLEVILPIWNHPSLAKCGVDLISTVVSILTHIYTGINDTPVHRNTGASLWGPPPDEASVSMIVEMGFSRVRAEEALRRVVENSVEMAMEWLFSHPEEPEEEDELARALALSLGSSDALPDAEGDGDKGKEVSPEESIVKAPPVEEILCTCFRLLQSTDAIAFPLTDLLVTICDRNTGKDRVRVMSYLIHHLKSCPKDDSDSDVPLLSVVSHILALVLNEDTTAREIAAQQGLVSIVLEILSAFNPPSFLETSIAAPKWTTALILILDLFLQYKQQVSQDQQESAHLPVAGGSGSTSSPKPETSDVNVDIDESETKEEPFSTLLGNYMGFMTLHEQHCAMTIACNFLNAHIPATSVQAVLQLCTRLTKTHSVAMQFLEYGGLTAILNLPRRSLFPGFDSAAAVIIRHLLEDPQTLQQAMELEIRHTLTATPQRQGQLTPRMFLTQLAPVILRDPATFMIASANVCTIQTISGQTQVVLSKERERERDKDNKQKEKEKVRVPLSGVDRSISDRNFRAQDPASKPIKAHNKKGPASFAQVIDQLLEVVLHSPAPFSSSKVIEAESSCFMNKGKNKCDDEGDAPGKGSLSERSAGLAKVAFILKLMMEILLMYSGAVGVVLRHDSESSQGRITGSSDLSCHRGLLYHILHNLLPSTSQKGCEKLTDDEWREKLSYKAAYFLLAVCVRSSEGRRRIVSEIARALISSLSNTTRTGENKRQPPSRKAKAFVFLINLFLSAHATNNPQAPGFLADMAKSMIDAGLVQALTNTLPSIDLDHPVAVKFINAMLRALEILTRVAATSEQLHETTGVSIKGVNTEERLPDADAERQPSDGSPPRGVPIVTGEVQRNEQRIPMVIEGHHDIDENRIEADEPDITDGERVESEAESLNLPMAVATEITFRPENVQDDEDDDEMDAEDGEEEEEDEDDDMEGAEGATRISPISPLDTDIDDHEDHALGDEYSEDMVEEEEEDWPEDRVIEVRWRDGLTRLNHHVQLLGHGGSASLVPEDPFQSMNEVFSSFRRATAVERRRPSAGYRQIPERPGGDHGGAFQHPLLTRSPASSLSTGGGMGSNAAGWIAAGNRLFGDRGVGGPLPPLLDFSMDAGYLMGRRGSRAESRLSTWTDDGQPQAGASAAAVAQCIEEHYVSRLRSLVSGETWHTDTTLGSPLALGQVQDTGSMEGVQSNGLALGQVQDTESMEGVQSNGLGRRTHSSTDAGLPSSVNNPQLEAQVSSAADLALPCLEDQRAVPISESQDEGIAPGVCRDEEMQAGNVNDHGTGGGTNGVESGTTFVIDQTDMEIDESRLVDLSDGRQQQVWQEDRCNQQGDQTVVAGADSLGAGNDAQVLEHETPNEGPSATDAEAGHRNEANQEINTIDPTFLEALPDYLRAEVLASHETQSMGAATVPPPALPTEDIDPEFLAALPPDIQAEVLSQQRNQRLVQAQQGEGQPVDMDSASIIATFPAELREEVLLTSSEQVLAALPPSLLAEAQLLRERAMNQYQSTGLFGEYNRFAVRRSNVGGGLDRAVGGSTAGLSIARTAAHADAGLKMREVDGKPLVNVEGLKSLLQLLHLAQPLSKGLLQRLLLNLCAHGLTRLCLVKLLLDLLRPDVQFSSDSETSRLYGCRWNVVYARSQVSEGVPPLVSRRVLEILTYLSKHLGGGADLLTHSPLSGTSLPCDGKEKGKAKVLNDAGMDYSDVKEQIPFVVLLKLLNQPLYSRSSAHLEQLMALLDVVTSHIRTKFEQSDVSKRRRIMVEGNPASSDDPGPSRQETDVGPSHRSIEGGSSATADTSRQPEGDEKQPEASTSGAEESIHLSRMLSNLPEAELRKLCGLLAQQGLSDSAYSWVTEVLKKLAHVAPACRWLFIQELEKAARDLCHPALSELGCLGNCETLVLRTSSLAGAAILRVLQCLSSLEDHVSSGHKADSSEQQKRSASLWDLNTDLEPLWQGLSSCMSKLEGCLGNMSAYSCAVNVPAASSSNKVAPPLPPETQRVLPFVEAFFVLSEKLRESSSLQSAHVEPGIATAREIKEGTSSASSPLLKRNEGEMLFLRLAEKHRRILNAFIRQNPSLLEKSFSVLLKSPRLIDFDNKRSYFRARIRQQHEQQHYHPLRILVRRPYVLEDSYNQLRMRTVDELKGRLTVQFQGEEGIDAGGLTREWYQLLSRVIFDKGALLFTTVGNESTFQPNPNSVFQTEHLSYFKFVGRVVAKAVYDGQLLDVYFTRSFYKHILGVKVTYHDIEAVDPDYYKNMKWMLENNISDVVGVFFSVDADEEKHILYEKTEVTDFELVPGGSNIRVTEENKHEYVDLNAEHKLTTAIRPQINAFLEGFNELVNRDLISIFNDKELELLISGLPEIDIDDLKANTEYTGYMAASPVVQWFWEVVKEFNKEDMARLVQFITGTSKVPLEGFRALQGISGAQRCQIHKAYGAPERLPTAHTCFNQLDLPEYSSKEQLRERLLLAIHEGSEGFGFG